MSTIFSQFYLYKIFCLINVHLQHSHILFYLTEIEYFDYLEFLNTFFPPGKGQNTGSLYHSGVKTNFSVGTSDGRTIPFPNKFLWEHDESALFLGSLGF